MRSAVQKRIAGMLFCATAIFTIVLPSCAENGFVLVQVEDIRNRPVNHVQIGVIGYGGSGMTGSDGKVRLPIGSGSVPGDSVTLTILHSPKGLDLAIFSPQDGRAHIPGFEDKPGNYIAVGVMSRGELSALKSREFLKSATADINKRNARPVLGQKPESLDTKAALVTVAKEYGYTPEALDQAIRAWGEEATDPYEAGLAALYERNYPRASEDLRNSLNRRQGRLTNDETRVAEDRKQAADAAFYLGWSLYLQGKYEESAAAYQESHEISGAHDPKVMNNWGLSLVYAGDYAAAEPILRQSLVLYEAIGNPVDIAMSNNNLGMLLEDIGQYKAAVPFFWTSVRIGEAEFRSDDPRMPTIYNNLATALEDTSDFPGAEKYYRKALQLLNSSKKLDPEGSATTRANLARLLKRQGDLKDAKEIYEQALKIPGVNLATQGNVYLNLGALLFEERDYKGAEKAYENATMMYKLTGNLDTPDAAALLSRQGDLAEATGNLHSARKFYSQALQIDMTKLGANHPTTKFLRRELDRLSNPPQK